MPSRADGFKNLLAPAISYSFDQFRIRVQDLLLAALFLEDIAGELVVTRRHLHAFEGTAESELCRSRFHVCDDVYKASPLS